MGKVNSPPQNSSKSQFRCYALLAERIALWLRFQTGWGTQTRVHRRTDNAVPRTRRIEFTRIDDNRPLRMSLVSVNLALIVRVLLLIVAETRGVPQPPRFLPDGSSKAQPVWTEAAFHCTPMSDISDSDFHLNAFQSFYSTRKLNKTKQKNPMAASSELMFPC